VGCWEASGLCGLERVDDGSHVLIAMPIGQGLPVEGRAATDQGRVAGAAFALTKHQLGDRAHVADRGLRREVPAHKLVQLGARHHARHRACIEDLPKHLQVDVRAACVVSARTVTIPIR
jgi:hypothetical protein